LPPLSASSCHSRPSMGVGCDRSYCGPNTCQAASRCDCWALLQVPLLSSARDVSRIQAFQHVGGQSFSLVNTGKAELDQTRHFRLSQFHKNEKLIFSFHEIEKLKIRKIDSWLLRMIVCRNKRCSMLSLSFHVSPCAYTRAPTRVRAGVRLLCNRLRLRLRLRFGIALAPKSRCLVEPW